MVAEGAEPCLKEGYSVNQKLFNLVVVPRPLFLPLFHFPLLFLSQLHDQLPIHLQFSLSPISFLPLTHLLLAVHFLLPSSGQPNPQSLGEAPSSLVLFALVAG